MTKIQNGNFEFAGSRMIIEIRRFDTARNERCMLITLWKMCITFCRVIYNKYYVMFCSFMSTVVKAGFSLEQRIFRTFLQKLHASVCEGSKLYSVILQTLALSSD